MVRFFFHKKKKNSQHQYAAQPQVCVGTVQNSINLVYFSIIVSNYSWCSTTIQLIEDYINTLGCGLLYSRSSEYKCNIIFFLPSNIEQWPLRLNARQRNIGNVKCF